MSTISNEEISERLDAVNFAIANNRLAGLEIGKETLVLLDRYIKGEIEADDIIQIILERVKKDKNK